MSDQKKTLTTIRDCLNKAERLHLDTLDRLDEHTGSASGKSKSEVGQAREHLEKAFKLVCGLINGKSSDDDNQELSSSPPHRKAMTGDPAATRSAKLRSLDGGATRTLRSAPVTTDESWLHQRHREEQTAIWNRYT